MHQNHLASRYNRLKFLEVVDGLLSDFVRDIRPIDRKHSVITSIHSLGVSRKMDLRVIEVEVCRAQANKLIGASADNLTRKQNNRRRMSTRSLASRQRQVKAEIYRSLTTNYHAQNALVILWASSVDRWEAKLVLTKVSTHKGQAKKIYTYSLYGSGLVFGPELMGDPPRLGGIGRHLLTGGATDNLNDLASRFGYKYLGKKRFIWKGGEQIGTDTPDKPRRRNGRQPIQGSGATELHFVRRS